MFVQRASKCVVSACGGGGLNVHAFRGKGIPSQASGGPGTATPRRAPARLRRHAERDARLGARLAHNGDEHRFNRPACDCVWEGAGAAVRPQSRRQSVRGTRHKHGAHSQPRTPAPRRRAPRTLALAVCQLENTLARAVARRRDAGEPQPAVQRGRAPYLLTESGAEPVLEAGRVLGRSSPAAVCIHPPEQLQRAPLRLACGAGAGGAAGGAGQGRPRHRGRLQPRPR